MSSHLSSNNNFQKLNPGESINSASFNQSQPPKRSKCYKIYTSTYKLSTQTAYHLATFNSTLRNTQDLPKQIKQQIETTEIQKHADPKDVHQMIKIEMKKAQGQIISGADDKKQTRQLKTMKYIFEENVQSQGGSSKSHDNKIVYKGTDNQLFSAKANQKSDQGETNFETANFALMMFDKKREAFRMVPIQKHIYFEKQKQKIIPPQIDRSRKMPILPVSRGKGNFLTRLKKNVQRIHESFIGGEIDYEAGITSTKGTTGKKVGRPPNKGSTKPIKRRKNIDEHSEDDPDDVIDHGSDDGNNEYDNNCQFEQEEENVEIKSIEEESVNSAKSYEDSEDLFDDDGKKNEKYKKSNLDIPIDDGVDRQDGRHRGKNQMNKGRIDPMGSNLQNNIQDMQSLSSKDYSFAGSVRSSDGDNNDDSDELIGENDDSDDDGMQRSIKRVGEKRQAGSNADYDSGSASRNYKRQKK